MNRPPARVIAPVAALLVVILAAVVLWRSGDGDDEPLEASGTVEATEADLGFPAPGTVARVAVAIARITVAIAIAVAHVTVAVTVACLSGASGGRDRHDVVAGGAAREQTEGREHD